MLEKQVDIQKQLIEKQRAEINKLKETLAGYESPREDITTATIISDQINNKNQEVILELEQQIQKMVTKARTLEDQNQKILKEFKIRHTEMTNKFKEQIGKMQEQNEKLKEELEARKSLVLDQNKELATATQQFNQERTKRLEHEGLINQLSNDVLEAATDLKVSKTNHSDLREELRTLLLKYPID